VAGDSPSLRRRSKAPTPLRQQIHNYFTKLLPKPTKKRRIKKEERLRAIVDTLRQFPELIDYYIKNKEERGSEAEKVSDQRVQSSEQLYVRQAAQLVDFLTSNTQFYSTEGNAYEAAHRRAMFLKDAIENKGCHRIFYVKGKPIERESDLQILYRLTWYGTAMDVTREANDGRGPADFKISKGARNKSLVEMKLAGNSQLERNLKNQAAVYEKASDAKRTVKIILYFSAAERKKVETVLKRLKLDADDSVVLVDARSDNKASGSKA
jgi:hypothetical protein